METLREDGPRVAARLRGLSKDYPGTRALHDVDLDLERGRVHALLGGNGSGKSTLIKILAGIERAERGGSVEIAGDVVDASAITPEWARRAGLRFVHQNPAVFPTLDVAENIALGSGYPRRPTGRIDWKELRQSVGDLVRRFKIPGGARTPAGLLGPAERTLVAIARALADVGERQDAILVLDEPTASLPAREVELLTERIRELAATGETILLVSHRLDEVLAVADHISLLRDGALVASGARRDFDEQQLARLIAGHDRAEVALAEPAVRTGQRGPALLEITDLRLFPQLDRVSLSAHAGEIVGIAGLLGSGASELLRVVFGAVDRHRHQRFLRVRGTIRVRGEVVSPRRPADAIRCGMAYVPADRAVSAVFADWSVSRNLSIARIDAYYRRLVLAHRRQRRDARRAMDAFSIKADDERQEMHQLSGGNQQKVVIARWLARSPDVLLLDEPTQGVDVAARADIHRFVRERTDDGATALVVTSDLEEMATVADRVLVLHKGRFRAEVSGGELTAPHLEELLNLIGIEDA